MVRIFYADADGRTVARSLDEPRYRLLVQEGRPVILADSDAAPPAAGALLLRTERARDDAEATWAVLCGEDAELWVNGGWVRIGLRMLRHMDEVRLGGGAPFYFSTERIAEVERYARDDAPRCPRCSHAIEKGEASVRCPSCGVVFHQRDKRPCWTYAETCALCDQPTALDAGLRWSPEEL